METNEEVVVRESASNKDQHKRLLLKIIGFVFFVSLFGGAAAALVTFSTLKGAAEDGTELAQQIQLACETRSPADPDLAQFCPKADEIVSSAPNEVLSDPVPGPPGQDGADGAPGPAPTSTQVLTAVRRFCQTTSECRGQDPTAAQVALAVASYCGEDGRCRGADGVDGIDAAPVTQDQIVQAVAVFCGEGNCRGEDGEDGTDGSDSSVPGPEGPPGVVSAADNCEAAPEGQKIINVDVSYDPDSQTVTISCSYGPDDDGSV